MVKVNVQATLRKNNKSKKVDLSFDPKKLNRITKTCAEYRHGGGRDRCMNCSFFQNRPFVDSCKRVTGAINQTYTCNLFVPGAEFLKTSGIKAVKSIACNKK